MMSVKILNSICILTQGEVRLLVRVSSRSPDPRGPALSSR